MLFCSIYLKCAKNQLLWALGVQAEIKEWIINPGARPIAGKSNKIFFLVLQLIQKNKQKIGAKLSSLHLLELITAAANFLYDSSSLLFDSRSVVLYLGLASVFDKLRCNTVISKLYRARIHHLRSLRSRVFAITLKKYAQSEERWKESTYRPEVNSDGSLISNVIVDDGKARRRFFKNSCLSSYSSSSSLTTSSSDLAFRDFCVVVAEP
ncbi:unnamed protein product [Vicia faba]|uniref:Uncharacterized protein n=1 Tax=Vicia faba TaxID=3906 RepID=A0AAV1B429_VICFA|nr:unnamed protein product [Vicia faba]